tara:strand:- start:86 stop:664 length:579 start_codon:yes stop_codon:yes gene_type:complete
MRLCKFFRFVLLLTGIVAGAASARAAELSEVRQLLSRGDHFVMIRHATAPGGGDPAGFKLGDCSTQRNLSDEGRAQAVRIGKKLHAAGVTKARVLSSQWCRCLDTAKGLGLGSVTELPELNSFHGRPDLKEKQMKALRAWVKAQPFDQATVLVTHFVVISALAGAGPQSGEMVIVRRMGNGQFTSVATIPTE